MRILLVSSLKKTLHSNTSVNSSCAQQLYSDRKPRACQDLGVGPRVGKCPAPGQHKIFKCPTPGTDEAGKCPAVVRGTWAQLELTDA